MSAEAPAEVAAVGVDKRGQVEKLLGDIFSLMEFPARLDFKDVADGGIAVAVHFESELPAAVAGKKNYLVDSIQFLVNKVVNRPNTEKRWVTLGVGAFPEPRPLQQQAAAAPVAKAAAPQPSRPNAVKNGSGAGAQVASGGAAASSPAREKRERPPRAGASTGGDELSAPVAADPAIAALGTLLAQKAAKHGRHFSVLAMSADDRARVAQAAKVLAGVTVKVEGDSYLRRVSVLAQKPTPMPKKHALLLPDDE